MADTFEWRVYVFDAATDQEVQDAKQSALLTWAALAPDYGHTPAGDPTATLETPGTGPTGMRRAWLVTGPVTTNA